MSEEENIDRSLDEILEFEENDVATITESQFKQSLLPMIASSNNKDADFSLWLSIAGSWRRTVDVVDDKTREFLFRVPALVGRNDPPAMQSGHNSAYEVIRNAQRKMQVVPKAGEEHLITNLRPRLKPSGDLDENRKMWQHIYQRYGLEFEVPGQTQEEKDASSATESSGKSGPDVVGYDDI
jgi:hypothetical protein